MASYQLCSLGLQDDKDLQALLKGSQLLKVKSSSWRRERFYKLQEDCKTIWQESRKVMRTPESQLCECPRLLGGSRVWNLCPDAGVGWGGVGVAVNHRKLGPDLGGLGQSCSQDQIQGN